MRDSVIEQIKQCLSVQSGSLSFEEFSEFIPRLHQQQLKVNETHNLTRILDEEDFLCKHLVDSLHLLRYLPENFKGRVLDMGCGGGFPSLVLAAAMPEVQVTALDSEGAKVQCVQQMADALELTNLKTVHGRAREMAHLDEYAFSFDVVTARAVATVDRLLRECKSFPRKGSGQMLLFKTPQAWEKESSLALREARKFKYGISVFPAYHLPDEQKSSRLFLSVKRES